ncbi:hypothetical protein J4405_02920 [Candidatus Woesearchaeota archaeon]|nr:hypothetical protein [Candidatus Woesearchaeota archaeon]
MKTLVFDTGSIISIMTNNLMDVLIKLKEESQVDFIVTNEVKKELLDIPIQGKRFKLEAIMLDFYLKKYFKTQTNMNFNNLINSVLSLCNTLFSVNGQYLKLVDRAEVEALVIASSMRADAYVVDERTMRLLVENPMKLHELFERKLHTKIQINNRNLRELIDKFSGMTILRSCDLMTIAYEKQLFVKYDFHEELLDALLWGLKLRGCSVSEQEIDEIIKIEINKSA